jgi:hypothetical protein
VLYVPGNRHNMDPMHDFRKILERQIVYVDAQTAKKIDQYAGELLLFWNWAIETLSKNGEAARHEVQYRLDFEIPTYLPRIRDDINLVLDPQYRDSVKRTDGRFAEAR